VFPFSFRNKKYDGCTAEFDDSGKAWCSTKTSDGEHVPGIGEWGYCSQSCPFASVAPTQWSEWSSCSSTCGSGFIVRSSGDGQTIRRKCNADIPCPTPSPPGSWSSWSSCSVTCGKGSQLRSHDDGRQQSQSCNRRKCPTLLINGNNDFSTKELWMISGDNSKGKVERLVETNSGNVCSKKISDLPNRYTENVAGYLSSRVMVCGGNSGYDSFDNYRVHNQCYSVSPRNPTRWIPSPSMIFNTTNAAYSVHKDNLYVFGGYQKPACGKRPGVQIFRSNSNSWSLGTNDPPFELGAYQCAVTVKDLIFVIGGWYPHNHYPSAPTCKEDLSSSELTAVNNEFKYYQDRVQVYDPLRNQWYQGPPLITRRRKHGCSLVSLSGKQGIMVVGGTNSRDRTLNSVEFLDLGNNLSKINLSGLKWLQLQNMIYPRMGNPAVFQGRENIYVIGGEISSNDNSILKFNKGSQSWQTMGTNTITKKFDFSLVQLPRSSNSSNPFTLC